MRKKNKATMLKQKPKVSESVFRSMQMRPMTVEILDEKMRRSFRLFADVINTNAKVTNRNTRDIWSLKFIMSWVLAYISVDAMTKFTKYMEEKDNEGKVTED